jgi:hypothetical protein
LDLDAVEIAPDLVAERLQKERDSIDSALLGYAKVDLLELKPVFRRYNQRTIDPKEVKLMVQSMQTEGIRRYLPGHFIPLVIAKDMVVKDSLAQVMGGIDLPWLRFVGEKPVVYAAGGQHRFSALQTIYEEMNAKTKAKQAAFNKASEQAADGKADPGIVQQLGTELEQAKRELKGLGLWGVAIYDFGAWLSSIKSSIIEPN